jgi:hypothetical protein
VPKPDFVPEIWVKKDDSDDAGDGSGDGGSMLWILLSLHLLPLLLLPLVLLMLLLLSREGMGQPQPGR